jgi:hypothetical protein
MIQNVIPSELSANRLAHPIAMKQESIELAVRKAFNAAHLLTTSMQAAECAVLEAIDVFDPDSDSEESLVRAAIQAAVCKEPRPASTSEQTKSGGSFVPVELHAVLRLSHDLRSCFVLRLLVGLSPQACAGLLRLNGADVERYACAAVQRLAGFDSWQMNLE